MCVIRKNCMEEIADIYGLKLCEDFILESYIGYTVGVFKIDKYGLWKYDNNNMCYYACYDVISRILDGSWGVRKMTNEEIVKEALNCGEK